MIVADVKKDVVVSEDFEQSAYTIKASAQSFDILSNRVYTHKVRAIIRELSCNANDSHIEAGNEQPYKVHLPTSLEPWFSVQDFGVGMSHEDCMKLYTTFFESTKRESNELTGCLGIGSKVFFCLVDSATITSVYDGKKRIYSSYKDEYGLPQMACLNCVDSDEHNGIEVKINISGRSGEFIEEAVTVYKYFDNIPDINNEEVLEKISKIKDSYFLVTDDYSFKSGYDDLYAVMGNVAYHIPDNVLNKCYKDVDGSVKIDMYDLPCGFIKFDMGDLEFEAGRENLSLNDRTISAIVTKLSDVLIDINGEICNKIEECDGTYNQAVMANSLSRIAKAFKVDITKYRLPKPSTGFDFYYTNTWNSTVKTDSGYATDKLFGDKVELYYHKPKFMARIKNYVKETDTTVVILDDAQVAEMEIPPNMVKDLDTLPKIDYKKRGAILEPRDAKVFTLNDKDYVSLNRDRWDDCNINTADITTEFVYLEISRWEPVHRSLYNIRCVFLQANNHGIKTPVLYGLKSAFLNTADFKRMNFISFRDYMKREVKKLGTIKVYNYSKSAKSGNILVKLADSCDDDMFSTFKDGRSGSNETSHEYLESYGFKVDKDETLDTLYEDIMKKYPMLNILDHYRIGPNELDTVAAYINERC
jgi:hypothetical protein